MRKLVDGTAGEAENLVDALIALAKQEPMALEDADEEHSSSSASGTHPPAPGPVSPRPFSR